MKFIKVVLLFVLLLLGTWVTLCFLGPSSITAERATIINAQPEVVYDLVNDLQMWKVWSPWERKDSTMVTRLSNPAVGMGATMTWTSDDMGNGSMQIIESRPASFIATTLVFDDFEGENYANFTFSEEADGTVVTWTMDGSELPFFLRGMLALMDPISAINKDYDEGLASLKALAESQPTIVVEEPLEEQDEEDAVAPEGEEVETSPTIE